MQDIEKKKKEEHDEAEKKKQEADDKKREEGERVRMLHVFFSSALISCIEEN